MLPPPHPSRHPSAPAASAHPRAATDKLLVIIHLTPGASWRQRAWADARDTWVGSLQGRGRRSDAQPDSRHFDNKVPETATETPTHISDARLQPTQEDLKETHPPPDNPFAATSSPDLPHFLPLPWAETGGMRAGQRVIVTWRGRGVTHSYAATHKHTLGVPLPSYLWAERRGRGKRGKREGGRRGMKGGEEALSKLYYGC